MTTSDHARRRSLAACLLWIAGALAAAVWAIPQSLAGADAPFTDNQAQMSLAIAATMAACGRAPYISPQYGVGSELFASPGALERPIFDLISERAGSLSAYCGTATIRVVNNENALMWMTAGALALDHRLSPRQLTRSLAALRVLFLGWFGVCLLYYGFPAFVALGAMFAGTAVLGALAPYEYTFYPFLMPVILMLLASCTCAFDAMRAPRMSAMVLWSAMLGVAAAFGANTRSSYAPICVILTGVTLGLAFKARKEAGEPFAAGLFVGSAVALFTFVITCAACLRIFVAPAGAHPQNRTAYNYPYHPIAHSLVMGLGAPENALSRAEGIEWRDGSPMQLAARLRPGVAYLSPEYEQTLFSYYRHLWVHAPLAMLRAYGAKLVAVGRGTFLQAAVLMPDLPLVRRFYLVQADRVTGIHLWIATLAVMAVALMQFRRTFSPASVMMTLFAVAVALVLAEATVIYSPFFLPYHGLLLFSVLMTPVAAAQLLWEVATRLRQRASVGRVWT